MKSFELIHLKNRPFDALGNIVCEIDLIEGGSLPHRMMLVSDHLQLNPRSKLRQTCIIAASMARCSLSCIIAEFRTSRTGDLWMSTWESASLFPLSYVGVQSCSCPSKVKTVLLHRVRAAQEPGADWLPRHRDRRFGHDRQVQLESAVSVSSTPCRQEQGSSMVSKQLMFDGYL